MFLTTLTTFSFLSPKPVSTTSNSVCSAAAAPAATVGGGHHHRRRRRPARCRTRPSGSRSAPWPASSVKLGDLVAQFLGGRPRIRRWQYRQTWRMVPFLEIPRRRAGATPIAAAYRMTSNLSDDRANLWRQLRSSAVGRRCGPARRLRHVRRAVLDAGRRRSLDSSDFFSIWLASAAARSQQGCDSSWHPARGSGPNRMLSCSSRLGHLLISWTRSAVSCSPSITPPRAWNLLVVLRLVQPRDFLDQRDEVLAAPDDGQACLRRPRRRGPAAFLRWPAGPGCS